MCSGEVTDYAQPNPHYNSLCLACTENAVNVFLVTGDVCLCCGFAVSERVDVYLARSNRAKVSDCDTCSTLDATFGSIHHNTPSDTQLR